MIHSDAQYWFTNYVDTLQECQSLKAQLQFVTRTYRKRHCNHTVVAIPLPPSIPPPPPPPTIVSPPSPVFNPPPFQRVSTDMIACVQRSDQLFNSLEKTRTENALLRRELKEASERNEAFVANLRLESQREKDEAVLAAYAQCQEEYRRVHIAALSAERNQASLEKEALQTQRKEEVARLTMQSEKSADEIRHKYDELQSTFKALQGEHTKLLKKERKQCSRIEGLEAQLVVHQKAAALRIREDKALAKKHLLVVQPASSQTSTSPSVSSSPFSRVKLSQLVESLNANAKASSPTRSSTTVAGVAGVVEEDGKPVLKFRSTASGERSEIKMTDGTPVPPRLPSDMILHNFMTESSWTPPRAISPDADGTAPASIIGSFPKEASFGKLLSDNQAFTALRFYLFSQMVAHSEGMELSDTRENADRVRIAKLVSTLLSPDPEAPAVSTESEAVMNLLKLQMRSLMIRYQNEVQRNNLRLHALYSCILCVLLILPPLTPSASTPQKHAKRTHTSHPPVPPLARMDAEIALRTQLGVMCKRIIKLTGEFRSQQSELTFPNATGVGPCVFCQQDVAEHQLHSQLGKIESCIGTKLS